MPIYEYQCGSCEYQFETIQRISEAPLSECPACGSDSLKKLISPVAFRLKGGGWYETDFKKGDARNVIKSESTAEKDSDGAVKKDAKGTESKSESSAKSNGEAATSKTTSKPAKTSE